MKQYYVYVYLDNTKPGNFTYGRFAFTAEPFYIGISKNPYRIDKHIWESLKVERFGRHRTVKHNKIIRILQTGQEPTRYKLYDELTFDSAVRMERYLIKLIGRHDLGLGPLANMTDGGEGTVLLGERNGFYGRHHTEESKIKIRANIGDRTNSNNGFYGKRHTEETKDKIRTNIGDRKGESNGNFGKTWSDEQIAAACARQKENHKHLTGENNPSKRPEVRAKAAAAKIGLKNPMACRWKLTSPDGTAHIIDGGIDKALKKFGLTYMKMCSRKTGCTFRSISGWEMCKI